MATYTVSAGHRSVGPFTVTSSGDAVTFTNPPGVAEIVNASAVDVYVSTYAMPTVPAAGASSHALRIPGGAALEVAMGGAKTLHLIAASDAAGVSVQS